MRPVAILRALIGAALLTGCADPLTEAPAVPDRMPGDCRVISPAPQDRDAIVEIVCRGVGPER